MKHLILVLLVSLQMFVFSAAQAWSPLDGVESAVGKVQHCYLTVAGSEDDQSKQAEGEEEEEEPECD